MTLAPAITQLSAADGRALRSALSRSQMRARIKAFALVAPLLLFVVLSFIVPIAQMLHRSVYNDGFSAHMPRLSTWFAETAPTTKPDEDAFAALALDLRDAQADKVAGSVGTRLNYEMPGARSLVTATARKAKRLDPPYMPTLLALDDGWADPKLWATMRQASSPYTANFFLAAIDMKRDETGAIVRAEPEQRIYVTLFVRTFALAALITAICLVLGYPVAHLLATLPLRWSNLLMILVLLPFWTSLLVRTTSWMVLLQSEGVINSLLVASGVIDDQGRIQMIYNQAGTVIAMVHILLPFTILPLYSVMRPIKPHYVRAARSLGATSWTAFRRVYLPQTLPGLGAGGLLVFILAVGYYITPALVGGAKGQMISNLIAFHMSTSLNWSMAAAIAAILLAVVMVLYWLYDRLVGIDNLKLG